MFAGFCTENACYESEVLSVHSESFDDTTIGMYRVDYKNMARIYLEVCTLKAFPIPYINQNNPKSFISNAQLQGYFGFGCLHNNLLCLRNGVDGWSTDDTTSNRKVRTGVHEESIDFPCTLATLIDTPGTISIIQYKMYVKTYQTIRDCPRRQSPAAKTPGMFET